MDGTELDDILSGADLVQPEQTIEQPTEPAAQPGQSRDEHGRFASPAEQSDLDAQAAIEGQAHEDGRVPQQALHAARQRERESRDEAEALRRENAQLRASMAQPAQQTPAPAEPAKAPDFWENPNEFVNVALTPVQQELVETRFYYSQRSAVTEFGEETVTAAETALKEAITSGHLDKAQVTAQLRKSKDPVRDVVQWHKNSPAQQKLDMREQVRAELLAEMNADPAATPAVPAVQSAPTTKLPPSLRNIPGGSNAPAGGSSDAELFQHATR